MNSIIAQNIKKTNLYNELETIFKSLPYDDPKINKMLEILSELQSGIKVQESSANIMAFIVQDLLDYAQIKSQKFRKLLGTFNIRTAIEKVMCI